MVISSSLARSNDQPLLDATRSTTSSRIHARLLVKLIRDMPASTMPLGSGMRTQPHASHAALDAVPGGAALTAPGANHLRDEYNPLIPAAKAQWGQMAGTSDISLSESFLPTGSQPDGVRQQGKRLQVSQSRALESPSPKILLSRTGWRPTPRPPPMASPISAATDSARILRESFTAWVHWGRIGDHQLLEPRRADAGDRAPGQHHGVI